MIAHYSKNLDWVGDIPGDFDVTLYNKGAEITSAPALKRAGRIMALANSGRESDTILRDALNKTGIGDGFTVFLQGGPSEHSPDITAPLGQWRQWHDVQPLAWCGCIQPGMLAHRASSDHRNFSCGARPWANDPARSKG